MSFFSRIAIFFVTIALGIVQPVTADTVEIERTPSLTLSILTEDLYQRLPAHQAESAYQQKIKANSDLADSLLANVASVSVNHYNDTLGSSDGMQEWEGSISMPLWLSGQQQQQRELSQKLSEELTAYQQYLKLEASGKVRELIWQMALTESELGQAYHVWQTAQKLEKDVGVRVDAGELASSEKLLATTHALEMHNHYLQAQGKLQQVYDRYQTITGESTFPEEFKELLSAKQGIDQAHPALAMLDERIMTLRTQQSLARYDGAVNPSLSVGVRRDRGNHSEQFNNSVAVGLSFALDDKIYRQPALAEAAMALSEAEISRQQLEQDLTVELAAQRRELGVQQQQLELASKHDKVTQQYVLLQQHAFDLGEIDLVSLLTSQTLAYESHNRKQLLEISIKQTVARINQALGVIL